MLRPRGFFALVALGLGVVAPGVASGGDAGRRPPVFGVEVPRVDVDFVARDGQGRPLRDLRPDEVEVYEDGVRQAIDSLRRIDREAPETAAGREPELVALAFDRLGPAARVLARQSALARLDLLEQWAAHVGVFTVDRGLHTLQPFTDDARAVRAALGGASSPGTALAPAADRDLVRLGWHGLGEGFGQAHVAPAEEKGTAECRGTEDTRMRLSELVESRLTEAFVILERNEAGFGAARGLLALLSGLQPVPGRKAVVLFSEGLMVTPDVEPLLRSVVDAARRARVTLYAVDAGGLRAASPGDEMRRALSTIRTRERDDTSGQLTQDGKLKLAEQNEDVLRQATGSGLRRLAEDTGGFLVEGTNDLAGAMDRVVEDTRDYYLVSYAPQSWRDDGGYRRLDVKVRRSHAVVRARRGYLAVRSPLPFPVLPWEAPALARLEAGRLSGSSPLRLAALQFPDGPAESRVPILVELPVPFEEEARPGAAQDLTLLVLVRDGSGRVVDKLSQRFHVDTRAAPGTTPQRVWLDRETRLPAGEYVLDAVALDVASGRAARAQTTLRVPPPPPDGLRASSLVLVQSAQPDPPGASAAALDYRGVRLQPNLGEPVARSASAQLVFYLAAWPSPARPTVEARVEVRRDGRTVAGTRLPVGTAGPDGRLQLVDSIPLSAIDPGAYELRVSLSDGRDTEVRSTALTVRP